MPADHAKNRALCFVVVCAGGDHADLEALLESIDFQRAEVADWGIEIMVVENTDPPHGPELATVCAARQEVRLVRPAGNIGYGGGINFGVNAIHNLDSADNQAWIMVCNADLVFPRGSLFRLTEALEANENEQLGLLAPRLLDPAAENSSAGRVTQPSIGRFPNLWSILAGRLRPRRTRKYVPTPNGAEQIDWATGACFAVRQDAFASVHGFDEAFFLDYEDVDLCKRLADAGWLRMIEPKWEVTHRHPMAQRATPNPARLIHTRASLVRYLAKHRRRWEFHGLGFLLRMAMVVRGGTHPMQDAWRAGFETYRQLRKTKI